MIRGRCIYCRAAFEGNLPFECPCGQTLTYILDVETTWDDVRQLFAARKLVFGEVYPDWPMGYVDASLHAQVLRDVYSAEDARGLQMLRAATKGLVT